MLLTLPAGNADQGKHDADAVPAGVLVVDLVPEATRPLGDLLRPIASRVLVLPHGVSQRLPVVGPDPEFAGVYLLNDIPAGFRPIVIWIDDYHRNNKLGAVFELKAGRGKMLVSAFDLETGLRKAACGASATQEPA